MGSRSTLLSALVAWALLTAGHAAGQDEAWRVKGRLLGQDGTKAEDVSGIACSTDTGFPRTCLVVDDETQGAQLVIVHDGEIRAGAFIPLIDDAFDGETLEFDGEGVAYADGYFYVIGSHGHPRDRSNKLDPVRDAAKIRASLAASSKVIRIRLDASAVDADGGLSTPPEITRSNRLRTLLAAEQRLAPFVDQRLEDNGLTIEGVAVRDGRLFAGLRGPVLNDKRAAIFSVAVDALFDGSAADPRLDLVKLGRGQGIRDLAAFDRGLLILAGPSAETKGQYAVFFWDGSERKRLRDLPRFGSRRDQLKAEALLPLERASGQVRVLLLFDGAKEGEPRPMDIPLP